MAKIKKQDILDIQEKFFSKINEYELIQKTILSKNSQISEIRNTNTVDDLHKQMSVLKADEALGVQSDVNVVENLQDKIDTADKNLSVIKDLEGVIAGLKIKAEQVEHEQRRLGYDFRSSVNAYLKEEAEGLGIRYMKAAQELIETFRVIVAVSKICERVGGSGHDGSIISGVEHMSQHFRVPVFRLESCGQSQNSSLDWPNWNEVTKVNRSFHQFVKEDIATAQKAFIDGMDINFDLLKYV